MAKVSAKDATVLINGSKFSTYATAYEVEMNANPVEVSGFGDGCMNYIPTIMSGRMALDMLWDTTADTGVHAKLYNAGQTGIVSLIPETYALGGLALSLPYTQTTYGPQGAVTDVIKIGNIVFESYGNNYGVETGRVLANATITNTATGTTYDAGAASSVKYAAILHVWTPTSADTYAVKVQHSTDGNTWADLVTFSANGQTITAERSAAASAVNRYRRALATRTGSAGDSFGYTVILYAI